MAQSGKSGTCTLVCWIVAIVLGLIAVKMTAGGMPLVFPLFIGLVVALVVGFLLTRMFCKGQEASADVMPAKSATQQAAEAAEAREAKAQAEAEEAARKAEAEAAAERAAQEAARQAEEEAARQAAAEAEAAAAEAAAQEAVEIKPSLLAGQQELETRKGTWKYEADEADAADAAPAAEAAAPAAEEAASDSAAVEAAQPVGLAAARDGGADDLKQIKGVGPKLEQLLNSLGIFHFDQIAGWGASDVAWMDDNLKGFKGRVSRDAWVDQAKTLATGGETEFSKRVEDGDVY